jgi:hypothetical protein
MKLIINCRTPVHRAYQAMTQLADSLVEYFTQDEKEEEDFKTWCDDNGLDVSTIEEAHLDHVFGQVLLYKTLSGYDIAPYCIATPLLETISGEKL